MTPYYDHAGITIYHADCREVLPFVTADALVTDPPYGIGFVGYASHTDDRDAYEHEIIPRLLEAEARIVNGWCAVYQSAIRAVDWARFFPREWRPLAMPKTFTQVNPGKWPIGATDYVLLWSVGEPAWPTKGNRVRDWFVQKTSDMSLREVRPDDRRACEACRDRRGRHATASHCRKDPENGHVRLRRLLPSESRRLRIGLVVVG